MRISNDFEAETIILNNYKPLPKFEVYNKESFLDKSFEVYFGRNAPLSMTLTTYCEKLKDLLGDVNTKYNFKDKKFVAKIKDLCDNFGSAIAGDVNAESCTVLIELDKEINAYAIPLICYFDNRPVDKNGKIIDGKVDLDKYVDLENIIQTKAGYKFKSSKNKLLMIGINIGSLWYCTSEQLAAMLCHEIGHCFQQGIFGSYKNYSDLMYQQEIKRLNNRFNAVDIIGPEGTIFSILENILPLPGFWKFFSGLVTFLFCPSLLNINVFTKINQFLHSKIHGRIVEEKTWKMKEKLDEMDNDKLSNTDRYRMMVNTHSDNTNRKKAIEDEQKAVLKSYKKIDLYKDQKLSKFTKWKRELWMSFAAVAYDLNNHLNNFWMTVSLSRFAQNKYANQVFYRKYEHFADIFASAYGFGPSMYKNLIIMDKSNKDYIDNQLFTRGIYKVPLFKAIAIYGAYNRERDYIAVDEHGETYQRSSAIYTNLVNELKNNPDLTPSQKKALLNDCNMFKKLDDEYHENMKRNGCLYNIYNKMINKKITTKDETIENLVLEPIMEVAIENQSKKK